MREPEFALVRAGGGVSLALRVFPVEPGEAAPTVLVIDRYHLMRIALGPDSLPKSVLTAWIEELNRGGFNVVFMDSRGSGSSGGASRDWFDDRLHVDVTAVVAWIRSRRWATGWVAAAGRSWSGTAALIVARDGGGLFQAVCAEMCPLDLSSLVWPSGRLRHGFVYGWSDRVAALDCGDAEPTEIEDRSRRADHRANVDPVALAFARSVGRARHPSILSSVANWTSTTPVLLLAGWFDAFVADMLELFEVKRSTAPWHLEVGPWSHLGMTGSRLGQFEVEWLGRALRGDLVEDTKAVTRLSYGAPMPRVREAPHRRVQAKRLTKIPVVIPSPLVGAMRRVSGCHSTGNGSRWHNAYGALLCYDKFTESPSCAVFVSPALPTEVYLDGRPRLYMHVRSDRPFTIFAYLLEVDESGRTDYLSEGQSSGEFAGWGAAINLELMPVGFLARRGCKIAIAIAASDSDNTFENHTSFDLLGGSHVENYLELSVSDKVSSTKGASSRLLTSSNEIQATSTVLPPGFSLRSGRSSTTSAR